MTTTGPDLTDQALRDDPHGWFARLRDEGPVLRGRMFDGSTGWFALRDAEVRAVLADPRFVNDVRSLPAGCARPSSMGIPDLPADVARHLERSILDTDGAEHTRLRKLVARAFTVRRVAELRPRVVAITEALLDAVEEARPGPVDLLESYADPLAITVIGELVGVPEPDRAIWRDRTSAMVAMEADPIVAAVRELDAYVRDLAAARRAAPAPDLLTDLVRAQVDGDRLSPDELVTMVMGLVFAGRRTTTHLLGNAVVTLLGRPGQLDRLRRDPSGWPVAVHELMRLWSPVHVAQPRYATEDVELGGVVVRAGDAVIPALTAANTDPRRHPDGERFDVGRQPAGPGDGHVGFGYGPHHCLGAALARQEAEVALSALFRRFPDIVLDAEPEWAATPGTRMLTALPVRV